MKTKDEIVEDWLPRYTGCPLDNFGEYILLTNFSHYLELFAEWNNVEIFDPNANMQCATADGITMINFGMGSANAATIMDLLSAIKPKAALFLGKCGGLKKKNELGGYIIPIGAIRSEGTSNDYYHPKYLHYQPLNYKWQLLLLLEITKKTITQVPFLQQTNEYGNMMSASKNIYKKPDLWQLIWKLPLSLPSDLQMESQQALYYL
jgi:hypothetical protein